MPNNNISFLSSGGMGGTTTISGTSSVILTGEGYFNTDYGSSGTIRVETDKNGIHPELYFKYIKRKFGILEGVRMASRLKKLEKAALAAIDNGQEALSVKFMEELARHVFESELYAKGIKYFIKKEHLDKYKRRIRGGHISDTALEDFTRVIPAKVLKKKKEVEKLFDSFVIYHYWNEEEEQKREKKQKMNEEEKAKMKDPVLFGRKNNDTRLFFIADWIDEFCDLTFDEMADVVAKNDEDITIPAVPKLNL